MSDNALQFVHNLHDLVQEQAKYPKWNLYRVTEQYERLAYYLDEQKERYMVGKISKLVASKSVERKVLKPANHILNTIIKRSKRERLVNKRDRICFAKAVFIGQHFIEYVFAEYKQIQESGCYNS